MIYTVKQHDRVKVNFLDYFSSTSQNTSQKDINEYVIDRGQIIGKGNYSTVYACYHQNKPRDKLAAKVVNINILRAQKI